MAFVSWDLTVSFLLRGKALIFFLQNTIDNEKHREYLMNKIAMQILWIILREKV